ncbi:MAG: hypothetical protein WDO14_13780 [Bacteroidota bacterium]
MKLLAKINRPLEFIFLAAALIGLFFKALHLVGGNDILLLSMPLLALVYFIRSFIPIDAPPPAEHDFASLFGFTILPKVAMISCAMVVLGSMFNILNLYGDRLLFPGCTVLAIATVAFIYFIIRDWATYKVMTGYLLRIVPIFLFGLFHFKNPVVF